MVEGWEVMAKLFYTQREYRLWIMGTIIVFSLIGKDFTLLLSSFWIGWTVSKVQVVQTFYLSRL